ncbi:two-component regulator propeller domain-containing protein [Pseudoalteromonas fenneropenaei]|uniref:histidine kinase n=1 Tax=Pseudoalteromonas fenneropenaei TaxID=1737459 RepID=A0ABV7CF36_9GAMM
MQRFDYDSGLSQVSVTALAQDQFGYIWIGTQAGLNRFDGHEFKQFSPKQQSRTDLAGGFITALCHEGDKLWIGTSTGLSIYYSSEGIFRSLLASEYAAIASDRVSGIDCHTEQVVVSTEVGRSYIVNSETLQIQAFPYNAELVRNVVRSGQHYYVLLETGLAQYSIQSGLIEVILPGNFKRFELAAGRAYIFDQQSTLTVLSLAKPQIVWQKTFHPIDTTPLNDIEITADRVTLATGNGVYLLSTDGDVLKHWKKQEQYQQGLQDNNILSVMRDLDQDLWIGTETRGLQYFSALSDAFGHVSEFNYSARPLVSPDVRAFALDEQGRFWIATSDGPFYFENNGFHRGEQQFAALTKLNGLFITKVFAYQDALWFTTRGAGVYRYQFSTAMLSNWRPDLGGAVELNFNDITIHKQAIIASTRGHGMLRFDSIKQDFEPYLPVELLSPNHVTSLLSIDNELWFGSVGDGLYRYRDGHLEHLSTQHGLVSDIVFMLAKDNNGKIWVASEAGLSVVSQDFTLERSVTRHDGLSNDAIWAMVFDGKDHLWVGTSGGLSQINVDSLSIYNFLPVDGVQDNEFNYNAAWLSPDGRVFLGGAKGFNQFYPERIITKNHPQPLLLSEIAVLGKVLKPSAESLITQAPEFSQSLLLEHTQNIVSLQYASLEFSFDRQLKYFYRVTGLSNTWLRLANGSRQVNLLKLVPGKYQVEVYTVNRFNQHSPIHKFSIQVQAPWYWSSWSKLAYGLAFVLVLWLFFQSKQKRYHQVLSDNRQMTELRERLELSLWASGDELWDWHLTSHEIFRHSVSKRIHYGKAQTHLELEGLNQYVHPKDSITLEDKLESCIRGEAESYEAALRVKDINGNWVWVLDRGKVVSRDVNGYATRIAGALKDITELKIHQDALQKLNEQLEIKVAMRTDELYKKNQKLEQAMMELKRTQQELIVSEKMASLGNLVAGIAHEINTPLGVAITAITYNQECLQAVEAKLTNKTLKQSDLERAIQEQNNGYTLIMRNLDRAQSLIANFKQVAVDQSSETERVVNLKNYVQDVFDALAPLIKGKGIEVELIGRNDLDILTYPGAIYQIISNLLNNSVIHGFEGMTSGRVTTEIVEQDGQLKLIYCDNGRGVKPEILGSIFDPFVTSKRNQGGCGLGMHIVYNLVTQLLRGDIVCDSKPDQGVCFTIIFPLQKSTESSVA